MSPVSVTPDAEGRAGAAEELSIAVWAGDGIWAQLAAAPGTCCSCSLTLGQRQPRAA